MRNLRFAFGRVATAGFIVTTLACGGREDETAPAPTQTQDQAAALLACRGEAFSVAKPLESERYQPEQGGLVDPVQARYVVHTTQIVVRPEQQKPFFELVAGVIVDLQSAEGLIAYGLAGDDVCGDNRTVGIWESEEAMYRFVMMPGHTRAMGQTGDVSEAARVAHWEATVDEVNALSWDVAMDAIEKVAPSPLY
jgi:hypothetical protein